MRGGERYCLERHVCSRALDLDRVLRRRPSMKSKWQHIATFIILTSVVLAACQPAATPAPTEPPVPPTAVVAPTEIPFTAMKFEATSCDYGGIIQSIEAVDRLTVKFTMCVPDPAFPAKAAFSAFQIIPAEYLEATGGGGDLVDNPIGTGPFMFEAWNRGENVT